MNYTSDCTPLLSAWHEDHSLATTGGLKTHWVEQPAGIYRTLAVNNFFYGFAGVEPYPIRCARSCAIYLAVFACPLDRIGSEIILHMIEGLVDYW